MVGELRGAPAAEARSRGDVVGVGSWVRPGRTTAAVRFGWLAVWWRRVGDGSARLSPVRARVDRWISA